MIIPQLHHKPEPLDQVAHRKTTLAVPWSDWSIAGELNSLFIGAGEFVDACRDFAIVFVQAGSNDQGKTEYAPIVVFGLKPGENLYVDGKRWRGTYEPVLLRCYPFCITRVDAERYAVCLDMAWKGVDAVDGGQRIFDDEGKPTEFTGRVQKLLEVFEGDVARTRQATHRLAELDLMRPMRFDATLPDGQKLVVDGFYTVDEAKMGAMPDATVLDLHRTGLLAMIHAHWFSLGHMRRLLDWRVERNASAAPAPAA